MVDTARQRIKTPSSSLGSAAPTPGNVRTVTRSDPEACATTLPNPPQRRKWFFTTCSRRFIHPTRARRLDFIKGPIGHRVDMRMKLDIKFEKPQRLWLLNVIDSRSTELRRLQRSAAPMSVQLSLSSARRYRFDYTQVIAELFCDSSPSASTFGTMRHRAGSASSDLIDRVHPRRHPRGRQCLGRH